MFAIDWQVAAAIATVISTVAFIASAIVVVLQLRQASRERYFSITAHLFEIWQSSDFQHDQLFLLHMLTCGPGTSSAGSAEASGPRSRFIAWADITIGSATLCATI